MKKGFTLVELSIALIIIGLILGSAIKATEMITTAKAKRVLSQVTMLVDAQYTYYERMGAYAGDANNDNLIDFATLNSVVGDIDNAGTGADIDAPFSALEGLDILPTQANTLHAALIVGGPAYFASVSNAVDNEYFNVLVLRSVPCEVAFQMEMHMDKNQPDTAGSAGTGHVRGIANATALQGATVTWTAANICASDPDTNTDIAYIFSGL
jgi:prepilin-type N-terminal cleavage/methylation domain-containing protein